MLRLASLLAAAALAWVVPAGVQAQEWGEFAYISGTMGVHDGRVCTGEASRGAVGCSNNAPYVSRATGFVGIGNSAPSTSLHISGMLRLATSGDSCDPNRLGAMKYQSGNFYICKNQTLGWEPVQTSTSSTIPSIDTGLSGSIVFRDEYGYLKARGSFSISSTTGSVGIGAGSPAWLGNDALYVAGASWINVLNTGNINLPNSGSGLTWTGNGTSNQITAADVGQPTGHLRFNIAGTEAMRINSNGNVGIGTTTPSATLTVVGQGEFGDSSGISRGLIALHPGAANVSASLRFAQTIDANYIQSGVNTTAGSIKELRFSPYKSYLPWLTLAADRIVGIRTHSPSSTLHVIGSIRMAAESSATLQTCDANRRGAIKYEGSDFYICRNGTTWESLTGLTDGSTAAADRITSGTTQVITKNNTSVSIITNNVERVVIGTDGNVGIGQQPMTGGTMLGVAGGGIFGSSLRVGDPSSSTRGLIAMQAQGGASGTLRLNANYPANYIQSGVGNITGSAQDLRFGPLGTTDAWMTLTASGNLGIGIESPIAPLHISSTNGNVLRMVAAGDSTQDTYTNYMSSYDSAGNIMWYLGDGSSSKRILLSARGPASDYYPLDFEVGNSHRMRITPQGLIGIGHSSISQNPSTTLHIAGSVRLGVESSATLATCDTNRTGAIKYQSGDFHVCRNGTAWESLTGLTDGSTAASDRITSGTTQVRTFTNTSITLATAGITRMTIGTTGNIGIGTSLPSRTMHIMGDGVMRIDRASTGGAAIYLNQLDAGTNQLLGGMQISANADAMVISHDTDSTGPHTHLMRIVSTGQVAIGMRPSTDPMTPSATLHVDGSALFENNLTVKGTRTANGANSHNGIHIDNYTADAAIPRRRWSFLNLNEYNTRSGLGIYEYTDEDLDGSWTNGASPKVHRLFIESNTGNIGIGSITPTTRLHVGGSIRMGAETSPTLATCNANRTGAMKFEAGDFHVCRNGTTWESLTGLTDGSTAASDRITSGTTQVITRNNTSVSIVTAGTERMVIGANGNIGIGQQPNAAFMSLMGQVNGGAIATFSVSSTNDTAGLGIYAYTTDYVTPYLRDTAMIYAGSGTPNLLLAAASSTGVIRFSTGGHSGEIYERMRITSNGNVGIGTTTPTYALHVQGSDYPGSSLRLEANRESVGSAGVDLFRSRGTANAPTKLLGSDYIGGINFMGYDGDSYENAAMIGARKVGDAADGQMATRLIFVTRDTGDSSVVERATITPAGWLGLNTATPSSSLHVLGGEIQTGTSAQACNTNRAGAIRYSGGNLSYCNGTTWSTLSAAGGTNSDRIVSGTTQVITNQNTSVSIVTAGNERMVIGTTGNVGIGQQPQTLMALAVSGSTLINLNANTYVGMYSYAQDAAVLAVESRGVIPVSVLSLNNPTQSWQFRNENNLLSVYNTTAFTRPLVILPSGNIGIGTITPTTKLEVVGRTSTTTVQLSNNPSDACTPADYGTMKMINGRPYVCRP